MTVAVSGEDEAAIHKAVLDELSEICMYLIPKSEAWDKCHAAMHEHLMRYQEITYGTTWDKEMEKHLKAQKGGLQQ